MTLTQPAVSYAFPTAIRVGADVRFELAALLLGAQAKRPLVVTDSGLAQLPMVPELMEHLGAAARAEIAPTLFAGVMGNPTLSQVMAGAGAYRDATCDSIVALGGGAAMDVAKCIAVVVSQPGELLDYEDVPGAPSLPNAVPLLVALPTTAGTGSEVGRAAVVSDDITHAKKIVFDPKLLPRHVLADPVLHVGLPAGVTAATGMDALTHLIEAFLAPGVHPMCDGIALEGMRLVAQSLPACVDFAADEKERAQPSSHHLQARTTMLNAAMMGAVAFQKGLGAVHSCAHALSTVCDLHHGLANGVMLPHVMRVNAPAVPERFARMAAAVKAGRADVGGDGGDGDDAGMVAWLERLQDRVGVPRYLNAVGVTPDHLPKLAQFAFQDGCHQLNPRSMDKAAFEQVFRAACETTTAAESA